MLNTITVRDVYDTNSVSGKKHISVTSLEQDELVKSLFDMSNRYMFPDQKLFLTTVSPEDVVAVDLTNYSRDLLVVGEFSDIISESNLHTRETICKCFQPLVTDGMDVYCTNQQCGLTLASRFKRLAETSLLSSEFNEDIVNYIGPDVDPYMVMAENPDMDRPFNMITDGRFWGYKDKDLESILLHPNNQSYIDISTFLIESEFASLIDGTPTLYNSNSFMFRNIGRFYDDMKELKERRDNTSRRQNHLIKEFMWCLGIEALSREIIEALFTYELCMDYPCEPLLPYFYMLNNPAEMTRELGIHYLEAASINREVVSRKHELYDICLNYCGGEVANQCFTMTT